MAHVVSLVLALSFIQIPSLNSSSPGERQDAIESMATLGNREAVPALLEAYQKEPRSSLREDIVEGLGQIRDASAISALTEALLTDYDPNVRLAAVDAFLQLYIPPADAGGFFDQIRGIFSSDERPLVAPNVAVDPAVGDALALALASDFEEDVRLEVAYALGTLQMASQLQVLVDAAEGHWNREAGNVRMAAIQAIGVIGGQDGGPALTRMLRDEDDRVVDESIRAIGRIGYLEAFPVLSSMYRSEDDNDVRALALDAIAMMRLPEARPVLEQGLDNREDNIRQVSAEGLARLNSPPSLFSDRIDGERDASVRLALAFALVASDQAQYLTRLIQALDTRRNQQAETYLIELGRYEGKLGDMFPHLRNPDPDIRAKLLSVLGRVGSVDARPYIEPLTRDQDTRVMEAAVDALRRLNP